MTKEQFITKWAFKYNVNYTTNPYFIDDLEAVIAHEIEKAQEVNEIKKNFYFYKQVMNPYETGSQSYTAYEKGFEEGYNKFHEIAKAQDAKPQPEELKGNCTTFDGSRLVDQVQPALNPIEQAYERGEKIRRKNWPQENWIQKLSETESTSDTLTTFDNIWDFATHPELWELYTEPTEQPSSQANLDNSFDKERFEAMFRAVVASGEGNLWSSVFDITNQALKQLDAYYATKEGGSNG